MQIAEEHRVKPITYQTISTERWIGKIDISIDLPTIVFFAALHGNELTGVSAMERVLKTISDRKIHLKGNLLAVKGNLKAIAKVQRFIDYDLNRLWTADYIAAADEGKNTLSELEELKELLLLAELLIKRAKNEVCFVDLHTTSSKSSPFLVLDDTLRNRALARSIPATIVLGLAEKIEGTMTSYLAEFGPRTLVFESGQHESLSSINLHEAAIWLLLDQMNIIESDVFDKQACYDMIQSASKGNPKVVETIDRFGIEEGDDFKMEEGFTNFQWIKEGEFLAMYNGKKVVAEHDGLIFMPLYQKQGNDGYFITKRISPFWLRVSKFFRRLRADKLIVHFPGITKLKSMPHSYKVNTHIAHFLTLKILHLLGFRKQVREGHTLIVSRLPYDLKGPWDSKKKKR